MFIGILPIFFKHITLFRVSIRRNRGRMKAVQNSSLQQFQWRVEKFEPIRYELAAR